MAEITHEDLQELAMIIVKKLQEEFRIKHLSGNLANTIQIVNMQDRALSNKRRSCSYRSW